MHYVRTSSGAHVTFRKTDAAAINIRDIAHHLSYLNRYCGATVMPLSVAQHSVLVAQLLSAQKHPPQTQMRGLLHDAHEAYMGDIVAPLRRHIADITRYDIIGTIAAELDSAIFRRFDLPPARPDELAAVQQADTQVYRAEWRDLMPGECPTPGLAMSSVVKPWPAHKAEEKFLDLFGRLQTAVALHDAGSRIVLKQEATSCPNS